MTDPDRLTIPERRPEDLDAALRPKSLDEFVGQQAARENLRLAAQLTGRSVRRIDELLQRVGLEAHAYRPVGKFSAGMKRRVTLARLLLLEPEIALLDEPFTQLDPDGVTLMSEVIRELDGRGCLTVLATHDVERGRALAAAHLTLDGGRALSLTEVTHDR